MRRVVGRGCGEARIRRPRIHPRRALGDDVAAGLGVAARAREEDDSCGGENADGAAAGAEPGLHGLPPSRVGGWDAGFSHSLVRPADRPSFERRVCGTRIPLYGLNCSLATSVGDELALDGEGEALDSLCSAGGTDSTPGEGADSTPNWEVASRVARLV